MAVEFWFPVPLMTNYLSSERRSQAGERIMFNLRRRR